MREEKKMVTYEVCKYIAEDGKAFDHKDAALAHEAKIKMNAIPDFSFDEVNSDFYIARTEEEANIIQERYRQQLNLEGSDYPIMLRGYYDDIGKYCLDTVSKIEIEELKQFLTHI
jgi:hypothetical protein